jgi:hypothetical protein
MRQKIERFRFVISASQALFVWLHKSELREKPVQTRAFEDILNGVVRLSSRSVL